MPQLGEAVVEGTIDRWLKQVGERVERFEPLVEVMTDKVNTEIPSPFTGVLEEIAAEPGTAVKIGEPIAWIAAEDGAGESPTAAPVGTGTEAARPVETAGRQATIAPAAMPVGLFPSSPAEGKKPVPPSVETTGGTGFSPAVRRLAAEYGVELRLVTGTGTGGRVTRDDVIAHANRQRQAQPQTGGASGPPHHASAPGPSGPSGPSGPEEELVEPSALRRAIAARMVESTRTIPHAWMMVEADVTGLVRLRQGVRAEFSRREGFDLTYFPFFVKAVVEGLRQQPTVNASWTDSGIRYHRRINLGVAVAAEEGLVVPVLRAADGMSVAGIARAVREIAARARAGDLGPADMQEGTFTVNNTGALGSIVSMPIINPPQSGIITLETIQARPAVVGEGIAIRQIVNLSFSFDHRVADGLTAGRFMQTVRRVMEGYAPGDPVY